MKSAIPTFSDIVVFDLDGHGVPLRQLWSDRTAVLLFVRHFGCLFCRQQVAEMRPYAERIRTVGAELTIIGHGSVEEARAFRQELALDVPLLTDPSRQAYRVLGLPRSRSSVFNLRSLRHSLAARRRGFRQTRVAGDAFQQGGLIIVATGGVEVYRFISRSAGEHPSPDVVMRALAGSR